MAEPPVLAVDIGSSKLSASLVDASGHVIAPARVPMPQGPQIDGEQLWSRLAKLIDQVAAGQPVRGVGVGCAGPMRWPDGVVTPVNIPAWVDFPLRERLVELFPDVPVRVHNDAVCMTVGEHWVGAACGHRNVLGLNVAAGVGGGLVLDGHLVSGGTGNAGHIGHVVVDPAGPACHCGGRGCVEAVARGPALVSWAAEEGWRSPESTLSDLADDAGDGDPLAIAALRRGAEAIGVAIASATHLCDLDLVVLGGNVMDVAGASMLPSVRTAFDHHARLEFSRRTSIVLAGLPGLARLVGAAALVIEGNQYWLGEPTG